MSKRNNLPTDETDLLAEIRVQFPEAEAVFVGKGALWLAESASEAASTLAIDSEQETLTVWLRLSAGATLSEKEQNRLRAWLTQRGGGQNVHLVVQTASEEKDHE